MSFRIGLWSGPAAERRGPLRVIGQDVYKLLTHSMQVFHAVHAESASRSRTPHGV